ncbi:MAG TPA: ATP-binding protein [Alphaproteobacteria bacterium]|nr:ATP-binding protein [Alphaproteobacteria bacterium]
MVASAGPALDPDVLDTCEREPIRIPGSIQPHGVLLAVDRGLVLRQASANAAPVLGGEVEAALGRPLALPAEAWPAIARELAEGLAEGGHLLRNLSLPAPGGPALHHLVAHRSGERLILEIEPAAAEAAVLDQQRIVAGFLEDLASANSIEAMTALAAREVRRITGFDRVLVYRFDAAWNGTVVAEDRNEALPSYLDLRFPASDIPAQARELYRLNRLRLIPDSAYRPVPLVPSLDPESGAPLDLSLAALRSVSPVHLEYMRNMGTGASMSVSVLPNGALWGLISCHNREPRRVPAPVRGICELLGRILALQLAARERAAEAEIRMRLGGVQARLLAQMAAADHFVDGLMHDSAELLSLTGSAGAAVVFGGRCMRAGDAPDEETVGRIVEWLAASNREDVFCTDSLASLLPELGAAKDRASGLLAIAISKLHASYVLWFRPEVVQTVRWGGDPRKPVETGPDGPRLHPRRSFEAWKETVRLRSAPWQAAQVDAAKELRNAVVGIVLRRAEELAALNEELERSNKELEAFSYSVSHDLRAPFRHIVGYSELLREREGDRLSERGRRYVETIIESALSAGDLVDSLLSFSQMGRMTLIPIRIDTARLVAEVWQSLETERAGRAVTLWTGALHPAWGDASMLRLVLQNLLSNAIKYTRIRPEARIEVGSRRDEAETVFHVRDNGVGFDMAYVHKLFGVFQRLHRMEEYQGTGIGLANVRRIVERHGGRTWAEGAVDGGATFYFALPNEPAPAAPKEGA